MGIAADKNSSQPVLTRNHRVNHSKLLRLANALFYDNGIVFKKSSAVDTSAHFQMTRAIIAGHLFPRLVSVKDEREIFVNVFYPWQNEPEGISKWSPDGIAAVVTTVKGLIKGGVSVSDIAVISMYGYDARRTRRLLLEGAFRDLGIPELGMVDAYQGRESPIVILHMMVGSDEQLVSTGKHFGQFGYVSGRGLEDPKRFLPDLMESGPSSCSYGKEYSSTELQRSRIPYIQMKRRNPIDLVKELVEESRRRT
ncbi:hypothetical protein K402DRAFT_421919 [Aulographum hederae CBS 113979]|uniref:DNA2/NAM7 helicase-like C-terminal domain-containing protein n=1 Tax=Aulographum hederae CBS 113979 TaxID=1176131 RepID=A0A6G1GXZ3_9PEZI|nr:hypothetical protein K402DRAFT_421919 [Aulographum hederae CBS 113979]